MLRTALLAMSQSATVRRVATTAPGIKGVVGKFAAGESIDDAVTACRQLIGSGLSVTLDHLGEDTLDRTQAAATCKAYLDLLRRLADEGLIGGAEVSLKLSAVGQALGVGGPSIATDNAYQIAEAADRLGTTLTVDMEDHSTTDLTLETLRMLRSDFPATGAVLQAYLRRTESDCRDLSATGSRVRLCKGAYREPDSVAYQDRGEVDRAYVRCLRVLLAGNGYPMVATHDSRLIAITEALILRHAREPDTYEFQLLYGVRPEEQRRLAGEGNVVRVYVPYGAEWYGYLVRRMAERPANLMLGVRAMLGGD